MDYDVKSTIFVVVACLLGGCLSQQGAEPEKVDFFKPREYGPAPDTPANPLEVEARREPAVAPRFWSWFQQISSLHQDDDRSGVRQSIYVLFMQADVNATTVRRVRWSPSFTEGMGNEPTVGAPWNFWSTIPELAQSE